ncbi:hypothetical protein MTP99_006006 [Tenebrio molitor]|nr:hypothetical protein MTP99_006006 [Tenebrio molitor]
MWRSRIQKMGDVRQVHVLIQSGIVVNEISNKYGRGAGPQDHTLLENNDKSKVLLSFRLFKNQLQYAT